MIDSQDEQRSMQITLRKVLDEYRAKHHPYTAIDTNDLAATIGFLTALALPAAPHVPLTSAQREYARAAKVLTRCQRLLAVVQRYESL